MQKRSLSKLTKSVHIGSPGDVQYKGIVTPIFPSSAYDYEDVSDTLYPRYFNTPNQKAVVEKLAALENAEDGVVFSSGMAAIFTSIFAVLKKDDHAIFPNDLYGGTFHAVVNELPKYGIEYTLIDASAPEEIEKAIRKETKLIYVETPSNPTLKITDLKAISGIAKSNEIITLIDNTFASPVNQNPINYGFDIVAHSGTKYIGGHSDICCGIALTNKLLAAKILATAVHFGGSLDAHTCWLVERSLGTIVLRVRQQNKNALAIAEFLQSDSRINKVYYPGLSDHPGHAIAKSQMPGGFGGMVSFEIHGNVDKFIRKLFVIKRAVSLGGVESTVSEPVKTSHIKLSKAECEAIGITENLLRLSVGIEETEDLLDDINQALE